MDKIGNQEGKHFFIPQCLQRKFAIQECEQFGPGATSGLQAIFVHQHKLMQMDDFYFS